MRIFCCGRGSRGSCSRALIALQNMNKSLDSETDPTKLKAFIMQQQQQLANLVGMLANQSVQNAKEPSSSATTAPNSPPRSSNQAITQMKARYFSQEQMLKKQIKTLKEELEYYKQVAQEQEH